MWPLTSPPLYAGSLNLDLLAAEVLYIRLHGIEGQGFLYGDPGYVTALAIEQVQTLKLPGSLVFMEGCYGLDWSSAFLAAGARAVIGNDRATWGKRWFLGPAQVVGRTWLRMMRQGARVREALALAAAKVNSPHNEGWAFMGQGDAKL